jgi:hypothetical protein
VQSAAAAANDTATASDSDSSSNLYFLYVRSKAISEINFKK